jgi:GNAT superfamily N-acetyltransferase
MIVAQVESFTDGIEELKPILPLHHAELAIDPIEIPLDPKWDLYRARDAAGQILYVTLRKGGRLIGYFIGFLVDSLHNPIRLCAQDIFYTLPDERRRGAGSILFNAVEAELKRRGSFRWIVAEKVHMDGGDFFEKHGFTHIERSYWKMV